MAYGEAGVASRAARPAATKPLPDPDDPLTAPFWAAAREGRLVIQQCQACGTSHHPPVGICHKCLGTELAFTPVSGKGHVYSFVVVRDQRLPAFDNLVPYTVATVTLDDRPGIFLVSNIPGTPIDQVRSGMPVSVDFEEIAPGVIIPQFRAAEGRQGDNR